MTSNSKTIMSQIEKARKEEFKKLQEQLNRAEMLLKSSEVNDFLKKSEAVITKNISKFGERGAHILVPKDYIGQQAKIIIKKKEDKKE